MFTLLSKAKLWVAGILAALFIGLLVKLWTTQSQLSVLKSQYDKQTAQIKSLEMTNATLEAEAAHLKVSLAAEQQAVEQQSAIAAQFRRQAMDKKEVVKYVLKSDECANKHLPNAVIEQLQK